MAEIREIYCMVAGISMTAIGKGSKVRNAIRTVFSAGER